MQLVAKSAAKSVADAAEKPSLAAPPRTAAQIREHYEIEKELAARLRRASRDERRHLYSALYDELYRRVPLHPQLTQKLSPAESARHVAMQVAFVGRFLRPDNVFMEVGPGDCALSFAVTGRVRRVEAVDVSDEITRAAAAPANFRLTLSDGSSIPLPPGSVDVAYSNQLMEHLHPDDALEQLRNIHTVLAPGGCYVCITPNRLNGPHDVSRDFDAEATGFHLREYTAHELCVLFRGVGFRGVRSYVGGRGVYLRVPTACLLGLERLLDALPARLARGLARRLPLRALLNLRLVAIR